MATRRSKKKTRKMRRLDELRALRSPLRQDIVLVLESVGPSSVAEIAERLGRSTHSLYYHVRQLERAGLVRTHEVRSTGRRDETVYALVSKGLVIDQRQRSQPFLEALGEMYSAALRRAERGLMRTLEEDLLRPPEEPRRSGVVTVNARLTPRGQKLLKQRLLELAETIEAEDDPRGEATIVTIAFHSRPPREV